MLTDEVIKNGSTQDCFKSYAICNLMFYIQFSFWNWIERLSNIQKTVSPFYAFKNYKIEYSHILCVYTLYIHTHYNERFLKQRNSFLNQINSTFKTMK